MRSKSTYIQGNSVHGNPGGTVWIANVPDDATIGPSAPVPQDTTVHGNYVFFNRLNAQLFLQGTIDTNAAFNYLSGALGSTVNGNATVAVRIQSATTTNVYENTVSWSVFASVHRRFWRPGYEWRHHLSQPVPQRHECSKPTAI